MPWRMFKKSFVSYFKIFRYNFLRRGLNINVLNTKRIESNLVLYFFGYFKKFIYMYMHKSWFIFTIYDFCRDSLNERTK